MASRKRPKLEGGAVDTVKSVHDVLEMVQTALLAQVRRGGASGAPTKLLRSFASFGPRPNKGIMGLRRGIGRAVQARSVQESKGDIQSKLSLNFGSRQANLLP